LNMAKQYTIGELINLSASYLEEKGCTSPRLDAELLLAHVLGLERLDLYLNIDKPLQKAEVDGYRTLIGRRGQRIPVAYLTGVREFYSLPIEVTRDVLIPRPETEFLVDAVLELLEPDVPVEILEIGTGSGAVAAVLAYQDPLIRVTATDVSPQALVVAEKNAVRLEVDGQIEFVHSDLFASVQGKYRVICSNPPYIPREELKTLEPEVLSEPAAALDGGQDGLDFYRRILGQAPSYLEQPGFVVLEIGWNQGEEVKKLGQEAGLMWQATYKDYAEHDRVVVFKWP